MKLSKLICMAAICLAAPLSRGIASTLSEMVDKVDGSWMLGKWQDKDTGGGAIKMEYEWRLDKHVIALKFTMPDRQGEGMIAVKPGTEDVLYMAVDNEGGAAVGKWGEHDGNPMLKVKHTDSDGKETEMAVEHVKVDANTMRLNLYKIDASGEVDTSQSKEIEMVRQK